MAIPSTSVAPPPFGGGTPARCRTSPALRAEEECNTEKTARNQPNSNHLGEKLRERFQSAQLKTGEDSVAVILHPFPPWDHARMKHDCAISSRRQSHPAD